MGVTNDKSAATPDHVLQRALYGTNILTAAPPRVPVSLHAPEFLVQQVVFSRPTVLQEVTRRGEMVDFMMLETAKCPNCKQTLTEKTLIEPK